MGIACELLLAFSLMFFGTYSVLCEILAAWSKLGKPFECHCEYLRNNCECSNKHPGMEAICQLGANLTAGVSNKLTSAAAAPLIAATAAAGWCWHLYVPST